MGACPVHDRYQFSHLICSQFCWPRSLWSMQNASGSTVTHIPQETGATFSDPVGGSRHGVGATDWWENPNNVATNFDTSPIWFWLWIVHSYKCITLIYSQSVILYYARLAPNYKFLINYFFFLTRIYNNENNKIIVCTCV